VKQEARTESMGTRETTTTTVYRYTLDARSPRVSGSIHGQDLQTFPSHDPQLACRCGAALCLEGRGRLTN